jgi:amino acid permease
MFAIVNEVKNNSTRSLNSIIGASIGSAAFIYVLVAITGYLSFGNSVAGNIVGMYAPNASSTIGKAAIVVLVMFSYPLQVHPCRASVVAVSKWRPAWWYRWLKRKEHNGSPSRVMPLLNPSAQPGRNEPLGELKFAVITTIIVVLTYLVAMTVSSLDTVLAYVGATGSTAISFILPGLFYFKISKPGSVHQQRLAKDDEDSIPANEGLLDDDGAMEVSKRLRVLRWASLGLAIYGLVVMATCLTTNTYFLITHST